MKKEENLSIIEGRKNRAKALRAKSLLNGCPLLFDIEIGPRNLFYANASSSGYGSLSYSDPRLDIYLDSLDHLIFIKNRDQITPSADMQGEEE